MASAPREDNRVPGLVAKSDADNTPVILEADPVTKRLKVSAVITSGGGGSSGTQYTDGDATITHPIGTIPVYDKSGTITAVSVANPLPVSGSFSSTPPSDVAPATQNITVVDSGSTSTLANNGQILVTGSPTASSAASFSLSSLETVRVQVTGTWTGTLASEISIDGGTTWFAQGLHQGAYTTSTFFGNFVGGGSVTGATNFRMRATATVTGTAVVKIIESINTNSVYIANAAPAGTVVSLLNSSTATLTSGSVFTGAGEDVNNFSEMRISVISNVASATDGLSIQQSPDNTNWDITDTYTIAAATAKTFVVPRQARYFRIVYTNGGTNQASFRLQSILNRTATAPSSQRATDAYTNETDLVQNQTFNMLYNGTTWDRARGTALAGTFVNLRDSFGNEKGNTVNPVLVAGVGTAGTANAGVQTIQGIASMTPVQVSQATASNLNATVAQGTAAALTGGWPTINGELGDFSGTFTNATQTTSVTATGLDGYGNTLISINGTYGTATAIFEGSDDSGTTWYTVQAARDNTNVIETGYTSLTNTSQTWQINNPGFDSLRVRSTAVASGTVNVRMSSSAAPVASGTIVGLGTAIPSGTNSIGTVGANSATGSAVPANAFYMAISDGTNLRGLVEPTADGVSALGLISSGLMGFNGSTWNRVSAQFITGDGNGNQVAIDVNARGLLWNGSSWDRQKGDATNGSFVNVTKSVPGTGATNLGKAEDAAHTTGDTGVFTLGVRNDGANTAFSGTNGDYTPYATDAQGRQYVVQKAPTATLSNVASSATSVTILAANDARIGAQFYNDSTQICYLKFGTTASSTSFTVPLAAATYYELPAGYTGKLDGIWVSAVGNMRVTEET